MSDTIKTALFILALAVVALLGGAKLLGAGTKSFIDGKITTGTQD